MLSMSPGIPYVTLVKQRLASFLAWKLEHVSRDCNERADALAAVAASLPITEKIFPPNLLSVEFLHSRCPGKPGG